MKVLATQHTREDFPSIFRRKFDMPLGICMLVLHLRLTKYLYDYLSEDEYLGLQNFLLQYPESGKVVRGSGGVRKIRWAMSGRGKSGGVRVIYYFKKQADEIWLLTIYSKNEVESIPAHVLRQIAKEVQNV